MNWNKWVRQTHRWLSIAFTVAVIVNGIAVAKQKYTAWLGLLAVLLIGRPAAQRKTALNGMFAPIRRTLVSRS
jgi:hypothetical protein